MIELTNNIVLKTKSLGVIELRPITIKDYHFLMQTTSKLKLSDKEVIIEILLHQIEKPKLTLKKLLTIPNDELKQLTQEFTPLVNLVAQNKKTNGNLYRNIRLALNETKEKELKLANSISPFSAPFQNYLQSIEKNYRCILPHLSPQLQYIRNIQGIVPPNLISMNNQSSRILGTHFKLPQQFMASLFPFNDMVTNLQNKLQIWINQNISIFNNITLQWFEIEKEFQISEKEAAPVLRKYMWFICPSMYAKSVHEIIELAKNPGRRDKDINRWFIDYFSQNNWQRLESMATDWNKNKLFKRRMPIINNCIQIIKNIDSKHSNVSLAILPALIAQIDGFLSDYMIKKEISFARLYDDAGKGQKAKKGRKSQFKKNVPYALSDDMEKIARILFLDILFQHSKTGKPLDNPYNFNRHKIMHGENVKYGRKDYLIKAFMIIDYLTFLE